MELHEAARDALLACEEALRPGRAMSEVFDAHADTLDRHGLAGHRLNACGYSLGTVYAPCWMDWPMFTMSNPVIGGDGLLPSHDHRRQRKRSRHDSGTNLDHHGERHRAPLTARNGSDRPLKSRAP
ncbi:MAG: M24 family metallopeptidase [Geminicoccaceae bacterium]